MEANTPTNSEEEAEETQKELSPPHIVIGTESMQVDSTHITIDAKENPFAEYGTKIVAILQILLALWDQSCWQYPFAAFRICDRDNLDQELLHLRQVFNTLIRKSPWLST